MWRRLRRLRRRLAVLVMVPFVGPPVCPPCAAHGVDCIQRCLRTPQQRIAEYIEQ